LTYLEEPEAPPLLPYSNPVSPLASMPLPEDHFQLYGQQMYELASTCYTQQGQVMHSGAQYPPQAIPGPLPVQATQMLADGPFDQSLPLDDSQQDWSQFVYGSGAFFPSTPPQSHNSFLLQSPPLPSAQLRADSSLQPSLESHGGAKELVGMGLYDAPDSSTPALEPDDYRNSIISTLSYLDQDCPGKGLKLEETWKPAESDDEDGGDDDEETSSTDGSQDGPCSTEERQEEGSNSAMVDHSMILPHDGLFDEEAYLAASVFLAQSKTPTVDFEGLSWI